MRLRRLVIAMLCGLGAAPDVVAQLSAGNARVRGIAYDSLRPGPLENAIITIAGTALRATTDTAGRFQIENVPRGTHTFVAQHPALDSIGFTGISTRATIAADADGVVIAIPSFATLWRGDGTTVDELDVPDRRALLHILGVGERTVDEDASLERCVFESRAAVPVKKREERLLDEASHLSSEDCRSA